MKFGNAVVRLLFLMVLLTVTSCAVQRGKKTSLAAAYVVPTSTPEPGCTAEMIHGSLVKSSPAGDLQIREGKAVAEFFVSGSTTCSGTLYLVLNENRTLVPLREGTATFTQVFTQPANQVFAVVWLQVRAADNSVTFSVPLKSPPFNVLAPVEQPSLTCTIMAEYSGGGTSAKVSVDSAGHIIGSVPLFSFTVSGPLPFSISKVTNSNQNALTLTDPSQIAGVSQSFHFQAQITSLGSNPIRVDISDPTGGLPAGSCGVTVEIVGEAPESRPPCDQGNGNGMGNGGRPPGRRR